MRICVTAIVTVIVSLVGCPHPARADTPVHASVTANAVLPSAAGVPGSVALGLSAFVGDDALATVATCGG